MSNPLSSSEVSRFNELQNYWLVMEPISSPDFAIDNRLFTVPLGQTIRPQMLVRSGSFSFLSGAIEIEKIVHVFDDENEANEFITDIGERNIVAKIQRTETFNGGLSSRTLTEIHLVNYPTLHFEFDFLDANFNSGFYLNVFSSGSEGLRQVFEHLVFDRSGRIISDTYLKYFKVEGDRE